MKNIFSKVGFTVVIIAAVLGITGGIAVAAAPGDNIVVKVDSIIGLLNSTTGGLPAVNAKIDAIAANMPRMESGYGEDQLKYSTSVPFYWVYVARKQSSYDDGLIRHFTFTVVTKHEVLPEVYSYVADGDEWKMDAITYMENVQGYDYYTYEFDGPNYLIQASSLVAEGSGDPPPTLDSRLRFFYTATHPSAVD